MSTALNANAAIEKYPVELLAQKRCEVRYLADDEMPIWNDLVTRSPQGTVFCTSWWLLAVPGNVRVLGVFEAGKMIAGIPLYFQKRGGLTICRMPPMTHTWGVIIEPLGGRSPSVISRQIEILSLIAQALSTQTVFVQTFHPSLANWLPFRWQGFQQSTLFSYVVQELGTKDLWQGLGKNPRRNIRKAKDSGLSAKPCSGDVVAAMLAKSYDRQSLKVPISSEYITRLCESAKKHNAGECISVVDQKGRVHGAIFVAWCSKRAYSVVSGGDPELRASGAGSLLQWAGLQLAAEKAPVYDFAGSNIKPIETFLRDFGGDLVPYNRITNMPRTLRAALILAGKA